MTSHTLMAISDLQTGLDFISRLPLADPQQAHVELKHFLDSLLKSPPEADVYLNLLEQLRPSLCFIEEELARNYINKPLPLSELEEACFLHVTITWIKMARSYACCAKLVTSTNSHENPPYIALILHRCIYYTGMALVEHHRARRELPPGLWLDLHAYYASAERRGIATLAVPDDLDPLERSSHCTSAFLGLLLSELASPYSLSVDDQNLVRRWATIWSAFVSLHPVRPGEPLPPFAIDLTHNGGLRASANCLQIEHLRRVDTSRLALRLKQIRLQLRQKISPEKIGLGKSCSSRQCRRLLKQLSHPWSQARTSREFLRRATAGDARLGIGFEATYYCISGKTFTPPVSDSADIPLEFESASEQGDEARQAALHLEQTGCASDQWGIVNQSANGFRLMRAAVGKQIAYGQLLAVCPHDGKRFLLARAAWLMQERRGGLIAGVSVLPGMPQAIAARPLVQETGGEEPYSRAFMLSAALPGSEPSLVIPHGWFRADRVIELNTGSAWRVKLKRVISEGPDFEQVCFEVE